MSDTWVGQFLKRLSTVYHNRIKVHDLDEIGPAMATESKIVSDFLVHLYQDELSLRKFLRNAGERRVLIFLPSGVRLPFDIEQQAEELNWRLQEVFPKLACEVLRSLSSTQYQTIYELYQKAEDHLGTLDAEATRKIMEKWLTESEPKNEAVKKEFYQILSTLNQKICITGANWPELGRLWGKASFLQSLHEIDATAWLELDRHLAEQFERFVLKDYWNLFYAPYTEGPQTIDRVMHYLALQPVGKKVLICFDGMGWQEWFALKEHLQQQGIQSYNERSMFALLPSLTQISRRALFCGQKAQRDLVGERKGFTEFTKTHWPNQDRASAEVFLNADLKWNEAYASYDHLGIVINLVDDIAHAFSFAADSKNLMQKTLAEKLKTTGITELLKRFLQTGFRVFVTADHGSVWCAGNGWNPEKYLIEERAKRALMYPNRVLASDYATGKAVYLYEKPELMGDSVLVLPQGRHFFGRPEDKLITHGGIHPDEMIIPFVEVLK